MGQKKSAKSPQKTNQATPPAAKKKSGLLIAGMAGLAALIVGGWLFSTKQPEAAEMIVFKSPSCGCCGGWVEYLKANGMTVSVQDVDEMDSVKRRLGVPFQAASCHTAKIGGYVIEGHVPIEDIRKLLAQKPPVTGIAAPGMPIGSPGMEVPGEEPDKYDVVTFTEDGQMSLFASH
ncbi:MAG: DUF411 domain-containing protein [Magnetococcales bacterium]|nr:DUF411 domain-containing protein [Magnetococcales bacterium]